jgi:hypothetical protein
MRALNFGKNEKIVFAIFGSFAHFLKEPIANEIKTFRKQFRICAQRKLSFQEKSAEITELKKRYA